MTEEKQRGGKTVTQFPETQGAFVFTSTRGGSLEERWRLAPGGERGGCVSPRSAARQWRSHNTAEEGNDWSRRLRQRKGALRTTRQRASSFTSRQLTLVYSGQIRVYNSRYNPASAPNTLNGALIQALSGSSAACKFVIEDFNELASPRMARRSRDRKWLISIHFGNYRLNARADIIIRGPILCGDSLLRQSHSPGSLPFTAGSPSAAARLGAGVKLVH